LNSTWPSGSWRQVLHDSHVAAGRIFVQNFAAFARASSTGREKVLRRKPSLSSLRTVAPVRATGQRCLAAFSLQLILIGMRQRPFVIEHRAKIAHVDPAAAILYI
jgi:hypothetical protein